MKTVTQKDRNNTHMSRDGSHFSQNIQVLFVNQVHKHQCTLQQTQL